MTYPLIHPYGEDGYRLGIPLRDVTESSLKRQKLTMRVFEIKLFQLMHDLKKEQPFGKIIACLYIIEFQKRGLPHAHILLFLHSTLKNPSADHIDNIISAKIPNINVDPDGYNVINKYMIHEPCGKLNSNSPCMMQDMCTKHFPKKFNDQMTIDTDGFPVYKRRNLGSERTTATMESIDTAKEIDDIKTYLDCRYISATKACWRIFQFDIHYRHPAVERLPFHLPGEHTEKTWTRRKNGLAIGRIYFAHPSTGERFDLRILLNSFKGSTSYESIRTINGVTYPNFKGACYALGLLDDDKEWIDCLTEAAIWETGKELRHLFITIVIHYQVSNASQLWKSNYIALSEDINSLQRKRFRMNDLKLIEQQVEAYTLFEIESIMLKMGKSLKDIDGMPLPNPSLIRDSGNRLVNEELDYDRDQLKILHEKSFAALNPCRKSAYKAIVHSVENEQGNLFFINGHGGTGKTFLWNMLTLFLANSRKPNPFFIQGLGIYRRTIPG
ncbi:uncharacterized protein LOC133825350 [Humulus lupulus]|uniref:uncharacterized protein LOC133825350 n=1 Tax=Humulus lupulus TaxID=3486 RepID=UPI002B40152B|nr:uncharacterized protein LOC133825350 [Humulus lupulus]